MRRLSVGGGTENEAVNVFDAPVVVHQFGCEPIEQLRVCWWGSASAEIIRCRYQSGTKVILPDAIDDYPRGQRMIGTGEPASQRKTTTSRAGERRLGDAQRAALVQDRQNARGYFLRRLLVFTVAKQVCRRRF